MSQRSQLPVLRPWIRSPRFDIREHLGSGGAGSVFRAFDQELGRDVALKVLHASRARALRALRREFEALRAISHPNLVGLGELFEDEESPFFTMELVTGTDLCRYVRRHQVCDEARLRDSLAQLTRALRAIHRGGRVHRDIKPGNVRVTDDGRVVVLDLGLSTPAFESAHENTELAGTAEYMAPEQLQGLVGPEVDFYALGVVMFQCITGRTPFAGSSEAVMLEKQSIPAPPLALHDNVTPELATLCERLLAQDPRDRPHATEVLNVLEGAQRRGPSSSASFMLGAVPLVEREGDIERALAVCQRFAASGPEVLVRGGAGLGKSALLKALAQRLALAHPDTWVLYARAEPRALCPFQGFAGIVQRIVERLKERGEEQVAALAPPDMHLVTDLFPAFKRLSALSRREEGARPPDPVERRFRAFVAFRAFLENLSRSERLVIAIDDLHWADGDVLQLLRALLEARRGGVVRPRITWLIGSEAPLPAGWEGPALELELSPLSERGVRELADELLDARLREPFLSACSGGRHGGVPRTIVELIRHALFFGVESLEDDPSLESMYERRLDALDGAARRVLELCAVAGRPLSMAVLSAASELSAADVSAAVGFLRSTGMVEEARSVDERAIEIVSLSARTTVLVRLEPSTLREWNLRLLSASQGLDHRPTATLLRYQLGSGHLEAARRTAMAVARAAEDVLAFEHAAHVYELASAAWEGEPDEVQREVLCAMAQVLSSAGQTKRAAYSYDRASEGAKVAEALELRRRAAELWMRSGDIEQGLRELSNILAAVGTALPKSGSSAIWSLLYQRARLSIRGLQFTPRASRQISARELTTLDVFWSAGSLLGLVDFASGADFLTRAVHQALRAGEPKRVCKALCVEATFSSSIEALPLSRTRRMIDIAASLAAEREDPYLEGLVQLARASVGLREGRYVASAQASLLAEKQFRERCTAVTWELGQVQEMAVICVMQTGALDELVQRSEAYAREALERGDLYGFTNIVTAAGFMGPLLRDDPKEAERSVCDAMARWPRSSFHVQHFFELLALTQVDLYLGRDALARIDATWPRLKGSMLLRVAVVHSTALWLLGIALVNAAVTDPRGAAEHRLRIRKVAKQLAGLPVLNATGLASLLLAQEAMIAGDRERARAQAKLAASALSEVGMGLLSGRASFLYGYLIGGEEGQARMDATRKQLAEFGVLAPDAYIRQAVPVWRGA